MFFSLYTHVVNRGNVLHHSKLVVILKNICLSLKREQSLRHSNSVIFMLHQIYILAFLTVIVAVCTCKGYKRMFNVEHKCIQWWLCNRAKLYFLLQNEDITKAVSQTKTPTIIVNKGSAFICAQQKMIVYLEEATWDKYFWPTCRCSTCSTFHIQKALIVPYLWCKPRCWTTKSMSMTKKMNNSYLLVRNIASLLAKCRLIVKRVKVTNIFYHSGSKSFIELLMFHGAFDKLTNLIHSAP